MWMKYINRSDSVHLFQLNINMTSMKQFFRFLWPHLKHFISIPDNFLCTLDKFLILWKIMKLKYPFKVYLWVCCWLCLQTSLHLQYFPHFPASPCTAHTKPWHLNIYLNWHPAPENANKNAIKSRWLCAFHTSMKLKTNFQTHNNISDWWKHR